MLNNFNEAVYDIKKVFGEKLPKTCVVLGSGFSKFTEFMTEKKELPYGEISGFPLSTVPGHSGKLILGCINEIPVLAFSGRFHYYEGYTMQQIAFPVRVMKLLGVENYIVTNASGGINEDYRAGDLVLISDHIKFFDDSPLRGKNLDTFGVRFPDMTHAYHRELFETAKKAAGEIGVDLKEGVYAFMIGPSFETPAEIRALRALGADMVGMSTVPEVICANHMGMKVLGISCVCNLAAGILDQPLTHEEVIAAGEHATEKSVALLTRIIEKIENR